MKSASSLTACRPQRSTKTVFVSYFARPFILVASCKSFVNKQDSLSCYSRHSGSVTNPALYATVRHSTILQPYN